MCLKILGVLQCVKLEQENKFKQIGGFLYSMGDSNIVLGILT